MPQAIVEVRDNVTQDTEIYWEDGGSLLPGLEATRAIRRSIVLGVEVTTRAVIIPSPEDREP